MTAIKERETLNDFLVKYEVSPVMISRWKKGFMYLTAIIDVYSRFNVGQGGQFTCKAWAAAAELKTISGSKGFEKQN